jgi:hypothetical protein
MLLEELAGVILQVEKLCLANAPIQHVVLGDFPIALANGAQTGLGAPIVDAVEYVAHGRLFAFEYSE